MSATLEQQIARLEALPNQETATTGTAAEFSAAIQALQDVHALAIERQELAESLDCRNDLIDELSAQLTKTVAGLEAALSQRDTAEEAHKALLKRAQADQLKSDATLLKLDRINIGNQEQLKALRAEILAEKKTRKAEDAKGLAKQVKELQARNKTLVEGNNLPRAAIAKLKKAALDYKMVAAANIKLRRDNQLLDAALIEAGKDISDAHRIAPLHEMGDWGIYPDESDGKLIVVDKTTDAARAYTQANKIAKIRPVPAKVLAKCEEVLGELASIRAHMEDYQEAV